MCIAIQRANRKANEERIDGERKRGEKKPIYIGILTFPWITFVIFRNFEQSVSDEQRANEDFCAEIKKKE